VRRGRDIGTAQSKTKAQHFEPCFLIEPDQYPVEPVASIRHCHHDSDKTTSFASICHNKKTIKYKKKLQ
jgi:hypothetical protein